MVGKRLLAAVTATLLAAAGAVGIAAPASAQWSSTGFTAADLSTWQTNGEAWAVAAAGNNVFVWGTFTSIRPPGSAAGSNEQPALNFAVLNAATGAPTSCQIGFDNAGHTATVRALNVSPDGKTLYVGGSFSHVIYPLNGAQVTDSVAQMVAIDIAACTRIRTFHPAMSATVRAIASNSTNVFVGGDFTQVNGIAHQRIAKLSTGGALDSTWNPAFDLPVLALAIPPASGGINDDRVLVGGDFNTVTSGDGTTTVNGSSHALTILTQDTGAVLKLFTGFFDPNSVVKSLAVNPDGSAFYVGNEGTGGGVFDGRTAVSLTGPNYPQIWRDTCLGATQSVVYYKGVIYSGSHAHDCGSMGEYGNGRRQHLLAEPATPPASTPTIPQPQLLPFYPDTNDGINESIGPRGLAVANSTSGDFLWVVGEFTTVNGKAQQGMTRFGTGPAQAAPTAPAISVGSYQAGQVEVRLRAGFDNDDGTLTYAIYRDGGATPVWTGQLTSSWWQRPQFTFVDTQAAGTTHTYQATASDGTTTTVKAQASGSVTVASVASAYDTVVNADNPQLHWRLDEASGTFAADSATNAGTPTNNPGDYPYPQSTTMAFNQPSALASEPNNSAISLNGTGNLYSELRQPSPGAFSEETWFKTSTTTGGKIIGFGDAQISLSANYDRSIIMLNNGRLQFGVYTGSTRVITSPKSYNNGQWHQVVATQGATGLRLYVDNVLVASNATVTTAQNFPNGGYWRVGGDTVAGWPSAPTSTYFAGSLDEVAIYGTALTAAQVTNHGTRPTASFLRRRHRR